MANKNNLFCSVFLPHLPIFVLFVDICYPPSWFVIRSIYQYVFYVYSGRKSQPE
jgi:hypothetical protein